MGHHFASNHLHRHEPRHIDLKFWTFKVLRVCKSLHLLALARDAKIAERVLTEFNAAVTTPNQRQQATRWGLAAIVRHLNCFGHITWTLLVDWPHAPHRSPEPCRSSSQLISLLQAPTFLAPTIANLAVDFNIFLGHIAQAVAALAGEMRVVLGIG